MFKKFLAKQMLKKQMAALPKEQQEQMERAAQDPKMQEMAKQMLAKLSPDEQKQLMSAMMKGDMETARKIVERVKP